ncbi:lysis protein [Shimwellia blattae]|uniref:Putative prophage endopeptidase n=1 Tax=Shimwellia blattae (strain ATCC 29907 / DSM 4481 / JCM 1650 / NBRC 105725 / CDC 9005-74) TaxID=630626 RepID=I2B9S6_SHIBC|nr:lysis protein [Shimwellia blattae]AFJ47280.1 putative prophage endopeptidase [Shimwellia blattae DSM 4481 = NBRC 105725]GAB80527.1 putative bacteriophage lysis protein [Shimwellia blattae DSM 4481 = NBRC 105725]VDY64770.1 Bacteriophage lysis protein [Shimwellia blattae]VEC22869.1 Bacteriophage lysis protein [Shimwellia blattae]
MNIRYTVLIAAFLIAVAGGLIWSANHYRDKYLAEQKRADIAELGLKSATATITDMTTRQRDVAALDAKYSRELADAQSQIETLRGDVATGKRRLQLAATCTQKASTTGAASLDDGESPQLTADAELNYWRLRAGIETITKQVTGLQQYIREQCLN